MTVLDDAMARINRTQEATEARAKMHNERVKTVRARWTAERETFRALNERLEGVSPAERVAILEIGRAHV